MGTARALGLLAVSAEGSIEGKAKLSKNSAIITSGLSQKQTLPGVGLVSPTIEMEDGEANEEGG
jgi:hypothetical protein